MRCGCPVCGEYAVQVERGFESRCVCPSCGWECADCMGGKNKRFTFIAKDDLDALKNMEFDQESDGYESSEDNGYEFEED